MPSSIQIHSLRIRNNISNHFNAHHNTWRRSYKYILPESFLVRKPSSNNTKESVSSFDIEKLNDILSRFVGSFNFHNFFGKPISKETEGGMYRTIYKFSCSPNPLQQTLTIAADNINSSKVSNNKSKNKPFGELATQKFFFLEVEGRSFVYHQIRKMIALSLAIYKDITPLSLLEVALGSPLKVITAVAPGNMLYLESVHFDDNSKQSLEFTPLELKRLNAFKTQKLLPHLTSLVKQEELQKWQEEKLVPIARNNRVWFLLDSFQKWKSSSSQDQHSLPK